MLQDTKNPRVQREVFFGIGRWRKKSSMSIDNNGKNEKKLYLCMDARETFASVSRLDRNY